MSRPVRWTRFGHDRLYVEASGTRLGFRDLKTGEDDPDEAEHADALRAACDTWQSQTRFGLNRQSTVTESHPSADSSSEGDTDLSATEATWVDLTNNLPGQAARVQADEAWERRRAEKPIRAVLGRLLDVHTDERAWRIGANGEEQVARQLKRAGERDPRWRYLHAVPVGTAAPASTTSL